MAKPPREKDVSTLTHDKARRINNPTAEMASLYEQQEEMLDEGPRELAILRARPLARGETRPRDADADPQIVWNGARITLTKAQRDQLVATGTVEIGDAQLVWRGKDNQDWSDLVVNVPPLYIQEKVHPKAIIDDLKRQSQKARAANRQAQGEAEAPDLFADFNGLADPEARAEFYQHTLHWQNRFILGDSLQVMASLAEREALRGKVQAIYFDPPYGIKFNSNWQVSTLSRDVKDGKQADISREPEQVKAFRDTWKDGIHSYLTYLRDRLTVARELLTESGSVFVQISIENIHRVGVLMDEVFGPDNRIVQISFVTANPQTGRLLEDNTDYLLWYAKNKQSVKYRTPYLPKSALKGGAAAYRFLRFPNLSVRTKSQEDNGIIPGNAKVFRGDKLTSSHPPGSYPVTFDGRRWVPGKGYWSTGEIGMARLKRADRLVGIGNTLSYVRYIEDFPCIPIGSQWTDTTTAGFASDKMFVVQTNPAVIQRCILMATDPGDLVLDPTCGSGTTATVAEQWGRRWITIDTSRVALALARTRLMSARYPYYLLADSVEGRDKEGKLTGKLPSQTPTSGDIRQGFVYERAPHITLKSIANNSRIDDIFDKWQAVLEPIRAEMNAALFTSSSPNSPSSSPSPYHRSSSPGLTRGPSSPSANGQDAAAGGRVDPRIKSGDGHDAGEVGNAGDERDAPAKGANERLLPSPLAGEGARRADEGAAANPEPGAHPSSVSAQRADPPSPTRGEGKSDGWADWQIPRDLDAWLDSREGKPLAGLVSAKVRELHVRWWEGRIARQQEIDAAIAQAADVELLYDRPYEDKSKVRVAGPFTVESLSPHRVATARDESLGSDIAATEGRMQPGPQNVPEADFGAMVLENLRAAGVNQKDKADSIRFNSVEPWPGKWLAAEGRYTDGEGREKRAGILIGPEFGTLTRSQITAAAREASEARFDALIACAFNFDAQAGDLTRLGPLPILKARMNPDLHMSDELKSTGKGNLFVVFGEPDIDILDTAEGEIRVKVNGVDVFDPSTGEIRSDGVAGIACWFIDTDYNEESFFVRHAYFLGANDPYGSLKTSLRAEIDEDAWASLYSDISRPFPRPATGRIAVKVINHFGDEVLKVFGV